MPIPLTMPNLYVADMTASLELYRDLLGGHEADRFPATGDPLHVVLRHGKSLLALTDPGSVRELGLTPRTGNPMEVILWCADVDATTRHLENSGVEVLVPPYDHPGGHRRSYLADPDGNWLALVDAPPL